MKITIDTKEDSKEEIRKVIRLLSGLVEGEIKVNKDIFSSGKTGSSSAFANMFGGKEEVKEKKEGEDKPVDFSGFTELIKSSEKKEKKDAPKVVSY